MICYVTYTHVHNLANFGSFKIVIIDFFFNTLQKQLQNTKTIKYKHTHNIQKLCLYKEKKHLTKTPE